MTESNSPSSFSESETPDADVPDPQLVDQEAESGAELAIRDKRQVSTPVSTPVSTLSLLGREDAKWDTSTKRMVLGILLVAVIFIIWLSRPVIPILVFSGIIAYLLKPIVDVAERIHIPRAVTTILLFLILVVASVLVPIILAPVLVEQLGRLISFDRNAIVQDLVVWIEQSLANLPQEDIEFTLVGDRSLASNSSPLFQLCLKYWDIFRRQLVRQPTLWAAPRRLALVSLVELYNFWSPLS